MSQDAEPNRESEIEADVMNVGFVSWIAVVSTILIVASVFALMGVYYLTKQQQVAERQADAERRVSNLEAHRKADAAVVNGVFELPKVDDGEGNKIDGGYSIPVEEGMKAIVERNG